MNKMIAVVTGGTGGIGSSICQHLSHEYQVIACYFKEGRHEEARKWQSIQKKAGFDIEILYANLALYDDCKQLTESALDRYGHIDVLVNNAGIIEDSSLKNMTQQQWHQVIDANLTSVFNITRNVLPNMLDRDYGRIINISSINGRKGQFGQCNYAATKSALFGFSKSLALEVASKGITVNTISPGYIETPMLTHLKEDVLKKIIADIPVKRLGKSEEIARAVAFLAAPEAGFITGSNIDINGGAYM